MSQKHGVQQDGDNVTYETEIARIDEFLSELIVKDGRSEQAIIGSLAEMGIQLHIVKVQRAVAGEMGNWLVYNEPRTILLQVPEMDSAVKVEMTENDWYKRYYWSIVEPNESLSIMAGPPCEQNRGW
jgi:hypothetical protein